MKSTGSNLQPIPLILCRSQFHDVREKDEGDSGLLLLITGVSCLFSANSQQCLRKDIFERLRCTPPKTCSLTLSGATCCIPNSHLSPGLLALGRQWDLGLSSSSWQHQCQRLRSKIHVGNGGVVMMDLLAIKAMLEVHLCLAWVKWGSSGHKKRFYLVW
jgi:hypothetical protein